MEQEYAQHAVAVHAPELERLALGHLDEAQYEGQEQQQYACRTEETFLFSDGAEDEVGILFGYELKLGLRAVEESLALKAARTDGNLALVYIVSGSGKVFVKPEEHVDTCALMRLEDVVEHVVGRIEEGYRPDGKQHNEEIMAYACAQGII